MEVGGLRWGASYWLAANVSWPFAEIHVTSERICVAMDFLCFHKKYTFSTSEVISIRKKTGLFSVGIIIEHSKKDYLPFFLFWTPNYPL